MKFIMLFDKDICISKGERFVGNPVSNELEVTPEQYEAIIPPCKCTIENGVLKSWIPCDPPVIHPKKLESTPEPAETDRINAKIDYIAMMTGVEI